MMKIQNAPQSNIYKAELQRINQQDGFIEMFIENEIFKDKLRKQDLLDAP